MLSRYLQIRISFIGLHWAATCRILRYLRKAPGKRLDYCSSSHLDIVRYSDADWAGDPIDCRYTTVYYTFVGGNLVTWIDKK